MVLIWIKMEVIEKTLWFLFFVFCFDFDAGITPHQRNVLFDGIQQHHFNLRL
jgi:hypothetical protein